jgi:hypothetical protein
MKTDPWTIAAVSISIMGIGILIASTACREVPTGARPYTVRCYSGGQEIFNQTLTKGEYVDVVQEGTIYIRDTKMSSASVKLTGDCVVETK